MRVAVPDRKGDMGASRSSRSAPSERVRLTRERVLEAALVVIDRDGLERLSMRRLGSELGVEAMSLYNHVADKDDVLDGVVGLLWCEVDRRASSGGDWAQQARSFAAAVRRTAHEHPHAYPLVLIRGVLPDRLMAMGSRLVGSLREAGFGELAPQAMLALASHATSQALAEVSWYGARAATGTSAAVADWPPTVVVEQELPRYEAEAPLAFGLELLIEALEARLAARRA